MISADGHVIEPEDLWTSRLPSRFREVAPQVRQTDDGRALIVNGQRRDIPGLNIDFPAEFEGATNPIDRARHLDSEDIEAEVLYPQWAMLLYGIDDGELQSEVLRAYNDWLAEFCAAAPGRFIGIGLLPIHDMDAAERELRHVQELGLRGVSIPSKRTDVRYNSRFFNPLWAMIEEAELPVSLHVAPTIEHRGMGAIAANITMNLGPFRSIWPIFVFSGVLERHPALKMVLTEGGIGWLPSTLYDMDVIYDRYGAFLEPKLELRPSEYWRRQCLATFQEDPVGLDQIGRIGAETVLWGADFPHPEGTYPNTAEILRRQFDEAAVSDVDRELILGENARRVWSAA